MEIILNNRQRAKKLDRAKIKKLILSILEILKIEQAELGFHFVTPKEMAEVHQQYMNVPGSTDVITFDHGSEASKLHGEIFISIEDAIQQARQFKTTWQSEATRYIIHGLLHLLGHDDLKPKARIKMKREENRLLKLHGRAL